MKDRKNKLLYDVHETPPFGKWIMLALQHVFAMFGATILVPIIVNGLVGAEILSIPLALIASGIGTLIYIICTNKKSPIYLGSSFAFITPMVAGYALAGKAGVFTGLLVVGFIYLIFAFFVRVSGKDWIDRLLPPVVIGSMIMVIGLSLASVAINNIGITEGTEFVPANFIVALITFLATVIAAIYAKGFMKVIPFLVGIVAGYVVALGFDLVDLVPFFDANLFVIPKFYIIFKDWVPDFGAILTIAPVSLVCICEHIGDHKIVSNIIHRDLLKDPGLEKSLIGDGLATIVTSIIGGPANTTYGENTAVVGMSKVASVKVIILAAFFAIGFGFLGKLTALFGSIPAPVLGGVSIILYGFIGVNGLKVLIRNQVDFDITKNVIVSATMLILGVGGAVISFATDNFTLSISGMSLAAIVGILLNLILPDPEEK